MRRLILSLLISAASCVAQSYVPSVPAHIEFTLANSDPNGACNNPTVFYFNYLNSAMWGCQISPGFIVGSWVQQNPAVGGGVTSVNGQTGTVSLTIPTDNSQIANSAGYVNSTVAASVAPVQSVNGATGAVVFAIPTSLSQLTNDANLITAAQAPVLSVNGQTGTVVLSTGTFNQTIQVNGAGVTQRAKLNLAAGANTTITPTDNGTDTTTLTITTTGGGGGGLPDPGANGLVKRTALNTTTAATAGTDYYAPGTLISDSDLPGSITSDITGNAATATALKVAPTACPGGQFIVQNDTKGNPLTCGTAGSGGPTITSGSGIPLAANCTLAAVGSAYIRQTDATHGNGGSTLYVCSSTGSSVASGFNWIPQNAHQVNVMSMGAKADGSTDDQAAFQAAVNLAKVLNKYTTYDSTNSFLGADVYIPCGDYAIGSPITLPRVQTGSFSNGPSNGVVGLVGESQACTILQGIAGSGFNGVTGLMVTNTGTGYTSAPSVSFSGGCATEPVAATLLMGSTGTVGDAYISTAGSGCTSMPTCTISGGGGSGATCITVGRAIIEWADITGTNVFQRTFGQKIMNIGFKPPQTPGAMGIHFTMGTNSTPNNVACTIGGGTVCDRMEQALFENLHAEDDNVDNPAFIYFGGDCNTCILHNITNDPAHAATAVYQTVLIATNLWAQAIGGEGEGLQYGKIDTIGCGDAKGGSAPCFQGRLQRTTMENTFCDGIRAAVGNQTCYAFYNSTNVKLINIGNDGDSGMQIQLQNCRNFVGDVIGIGSPVVQNSTPILGGLYLVNSDDNIFTMHTAGQSFTPSGTFAVSMDSSSFQNEFFQWQVQAATEINMVNTTTNYMQYCLNASCGTNTVWVHAGTNPF